MTLHYHVLLFSIGALVLKKTSEIYFLLIYWGLYSFYYGYQKCTRRNLKSIYDVLRLVNKFIILYTSICEFERSKVNTYHFFHVGCKYLNWDAHM